MADIFAAEANARNKLSLTARAASEVVCLGGFLQNNQMALLTNDKLVNLRDRMSC